MQVPSLILIVIVGILLILSILFIFLILPIWTIVHCATASFSNRKKIIWIVLIVLLWSLGAILYAIFVSRHKGLRVLGIVMLLLCLAFTGLAVGTIWGGSYVLDKGVTGLLNKYDQLDTKGISAQEKQYLRTALITMQRENHAGLRHYDDKIKALELMELFIFMVQDKRLTASEYDDWMKIFEARGMLDSKLLNQYVRDYRQGRPDSNPAQKQ